MIRVPVRVVTNRFLVPPRFAAWVPVPRTIVYRDEGAKNERRMAHELRHVTQADRYGVAWPLAYVAQWARSGFSYADMPFEVDARAHERDGRYVAWARDLLGGDE